MDFKNVDLNDYCLNIELHKSMFFIDMLKDTYEFTLKGDEIEIFKKIKNGISEPITRKELIYSIQVEDLMDVSGEKGELISIFDDLFGSIDNIHKTIDNMVYLEKYLNKKEESTDEEEVNELGENKKLVLKNALEKECLSARTELFRPAWTPPR